LQVLVRPYVGCERNPPNSILDKKFQIPVFEYVKGYTLQVASSGPGIAVSMPAKSTPQFWFNGESLNPSSHSVRGEGDT